MNEGEREWNRGIKQLSFIYACILRSFYCSTFPYNLYASLALFLLLVCFNLFCFLFYSISFLDACFFSNGRKKEKVWIWVGGEVEWG